MPQARKNIFFIDRKGLVTRQRAETEDDLELHKLPYAHDIADGGGSSVLEAVKLIKPTALIGIRHPYNGKDVAPSECTTEYVFPGLALGMTIAEGTRVRESILVEVAETVAESASHEDIDHGAVFPRKRHIPELSARVAASVAGKLFTNGWSALPEKHVDWLRLAKSWMFNPAYRSYS